MNADIPTLTVFPVDLGVDCELIRHDNGDTVLVIRPHPHQSFDAAVERACRVLPHTPDEVRALLRPYFPTPAALDVPQVGEPAAAAGARRRAHTAGRRRRLAAWVAAGITGIAVGLASASLPNPGAAEPAAQQPAVMRGPLSTTQSQDVIDMWDVDCTIADNGWEAACQGAVVGAFTLRSYWAKEGVMYSSRIGKQSLMMLIVPDREDADTAFARMSITAPGAPFDLVFLQRAPAADADIIMWGDAEYVAALTEKATGIGYTKKEAPGSPGAPHRGVGAGVVS